jgi:integrase
VPPDVFQAVVGRLAREDRDPEAPVFPGLKDSTVRMAMRRACVACGIPHYHPHDLRKRRISLWHRQGIDWARIGHWAGQRDLAVTANTYTHVITDAEVDRGALFSL